MDSTILPLVIIGLIFGFVVRMIWQNCCYNYVEPRDFYSIRIDNFQDTSSNFLDQISRPNNAARNLCCCFNIKSYRSSLFFKKVILYNKIKKQNALPVTKRFLIRRSDLLKDSYNEFMSIAFDELKNAEIFIQFDGEKGHDLGGIYKDWIGSIIDILLKSETGLFQDADDNKVIIPLSKPRLVLSYYKFFGRLLAKLIIDKNIANVRIGDILYKQILNREIAEEDFKLTDRDYYRILQSVKEDPNSSNLYFTNSFDENLIENGNSIKVTEDNVESFINLCLENKYVSGVKEKIDLIKEGLYELIDENFFEDWTPEEFKLLICGVPRIDVEDWKSKTTYFGFSKKNKTIVWFWEIVSNFSEEDKMNLLHFVTGVTSVPSEGFKFLPKGDGRQLKFCIRRLEFYNLPLGHTCSNILDLAVYESKAKLKEDLKIAIAHSYNEFDLE